MASRRLDPAALAHQEWLDFVRPTGLVFSAPALVQAGAILDRCDSEGQRLLARCVVPRRFDPGQDEQPCLADFTVFARTVLDWSFSPKAYAGTPEAPIPAELEVHLPDYAETLRPDFAVRELDPREGASPWQLLVHILDPGADFDRITAGRGRLEASPHGRMERLLRQTGVPAGLLVSGRTLRLLSAPRGESSGWLDFRVADMLQPAGRPILSAMRLLLRQQRLLTLPRNQRFAALLEDSRRFQNEVSERLAEQVLHALYELLRGFQAAHESSQGRLLREPLAEHPDEIYHALLTVVLRMVFLLYAEALDMLPRDETFVRHYSLAGLYERLREDAAHYPDTMGQRYGAWAQLLVLFRMIHDGADAGSLHLPRRYGVLFAPDRFKFLEGRPAAGARQIHQRIEAPLVPDGTVYRALEKLLVLDGERISYRALDVEQIGSVYETMMGFRLELATGRTVAVKPQKKHGAPTALDLDALLSVPAAKRSKWIGERADRKLTDRLAKAVRAAGTLEELHAALTPVIDAAATPDLVPEGAVVLQPSDARRRSGSHYTPRSLTRPIVEHTLEPLLGRLRDEAGGVPKPAQILDLKICDPAMGSGAFLVETCRQLADALSEAWHAHGELPTIPVDEDEIVFARRMVAQRCLYGVDANPLAVDLAKVSLWLLTLTSDHALTFLEHALRHGDSLVGLSARQIEAFHWDRRAQAFDSDLSTRIRVHVQRIAELRGLIRTAGEDVSDSELRDLWDEARSELERVRLFGDLVVAAFFEGETDRARERRRSDFVPAVVSGDVECYRAWIEERRHARPPLAPFHWEIELPEVFRRENPGFDAFVGNPPFAGKNTTATAHVPGYTLWLRQLHEESHGNSDLVAHFFRRAFDLLRQGGTFGLIATNTIGQGDTRATGLRWICQHGGEIYRARRRVQWPGLAAVVVSVVHGVRGHHAGARYLDTREVERITAFLFHRAGHTDPARLLANSGKSFQGSIVLGMGFTFDDTDSRGVATPLSEMRRLIERDPRNREAIFPYIGGEEVNSSPTQSHHRYVINFGQRGEEECRREWPDLMAIVEEKVRGTRGSHSTAPWWQFERLRPELYSAIAGMERVLVCSLVSNKLQLAFLPRSMVYSHKLCVFTFGGCDAFAVLQSGVHEAWTRLFSSTMKDDINYSPSDCFDTFPFPEHWATAELETVGTAYYEHRGSLMLKNDEGLTRTYNRFHDPGESDPQIIELRDLHAAMDRAVLDAYDWHDIPTDCKFLLDYEVEEEEPGRRRRKPWRYRWPDDVRDEVLARLLELNAERAREEVRSGAAASGRRGGSASGARSGAKSKQAGLFE